MLAAESTFATLARLSHEGTLDPDFTPKSVLQAAITFYTAMPSISLAGLPVPVQRVLFRVLAQLARRRGYQPY